VYGPTPGNLSSETRSDGTRPLFDWVIATAARWRLRARRL
jgi:hypothetical protein